MPTQFKPKTIIFIFHNINIIYNYIICSDWVLEAVHVEGNLNPKQSVFFRMELCATPDANVLCDFVIPPTGNTSMLTAVVWF